MIKKIANWTFGSVFRTFGRIIAYLIFGLALSYILSSLDFRITDLFFDSVKADTLTTNKWTTFYNDANKTNALSGKGNLHQYFQLASNGNGVTSKTLYFNANIVKESTYDYIKIPFMLTGADMATTTETQYFCSYKLVNNEYIPYTCSYQGSDTVSIPISLNYRFSATLITDGGGLTTCSFETDNIKCYLNPGYTYIGLNFTYNVWQDSLPYLQALFGHTVGYYKDSQNTIIENQQTIIQQQNESLQQQQNTTQEILDSNTTQAEDDAQGFFDDFDVPDVGGLSAIITAPLNTIRSLLSSTCSKLILPLPYVNENLELPCMNEIYTQHFGLFFSLYQTIMLAIISYRCIRSIYFDITGFTNPDDDRIEVMDL